MIQFKCATQSKPIFIGLPALVVIHAELFLRFFDFNYWITLINHL